MRCAAIAFAAVALVALPSAAARPIAWTFAYGTNAGIVERTAAGGVVHLGGGSDFLQIAWSPNGRYLAYENNSQAGVFVVDRDGGNRRRLSSDLVRSNADGYFVWSPDSRSLAWPNAAGVSSAGSVTVAAIDGSRVMHVLRGADGAIAWLDASRIVCACDGGLLILDLRSGARTALVRHHSRVAYPAASSDGREIAFGRDCFEDFHQDVYCGLGIIRSDGTHKHALISHRSGGYSGVTGPVSWIPGTHRFLVTEVETAAGVELLDADTKHRTALRGRATFLWQIGGVAPDGTFVLDEGAQLEVCSPSGRVLRRPPFGFAVAFPG